MQEYINDPEGVTKRIKKEQEERQRKEITPDDQEVLRDIF